MRSFGHFVSPFVLFLTAALLIFGAAGVSIADTQVAQRHQYTIQGRTMGTFYSIKYISREKIDEQSWKAKTDERLRQINHHLSMFDLKSELSSFNRTAINTPMQISDGFYAILELGHRLYRLTGGAWDATVKPLVDLWGFGVKNPERRLPEKTKIRQVLSETGYSHIQLLSGKRVEKSRNITVDLGSIAKGYGVDAMAELFTSADIQDVLVEIGGEVRASGENRHGIPWVVGISRPEKNMANQGVFKAVQLDEKAIATSGNYRNFFEKDGRTYSHIINPKTGYPVENQIVSTSVIAPDCALADGLATALMVMTIQEGLDLINSLPDVECLLVQQKGKELMTHPSQNFRSYLYDY